MNIRIGIKVFAVALLLCTSACHKKKEQKEDNTTPKTSYGEAVQKSKDASKKVGEHDAETAKQADQLKEDK